MVMVVTMRVKRRESDDIGCNTDEGEGDGEGHREDGEGARLVHICDL